jgi:hypothetical protein
LTVSGGRRNVRTDSDAPLFGDTEPEQKLLKKIVARIQGGLGNQLFCYAAARRLALINNAELVLDHVTGFVRDYQFGRRYQLDHCTIPCRLATARERMEPLERIRRKVRRELSQFVPYQMRSYVAQRGDDFDPRLLKFRVKGTVYLDGLWQSHEYFRDVEGQIRCDLRIKPPVDAANVTMAGLIRSSNAVAVHLRWFDAPGTPEVHNAAVAYYRRAIDLVESKLGSPRFFVFSDHPEAARQRLDLPPERTTLVGHNRSDDVAYADLWLMSQCLHFITANSTFSWWGAWLSENVDKLIICPKSGGDAAWNFEGQLPPEWIKL